MMRHSRALRRILSRQPIGSRNLRSSAALLDALDMPDTFARRHSKSPFAIGVSRSETLVNCWHPLRVFYVHTDLQNSSSSYDDALHYDTLFKLITVRFLTKNID